MARRALMIIDILMDFMHPEGALYCGDQARAILPRVAELLDEHRRQGSLIIFVADRHEPDDLEFKLFPPHCVAGTPGADFLPEVRPRPGEYVVPKRRYSAFYGTDLEEILTREGVDEIHLAGVCTSICVMDTCSDLRNRDLKAVVHQQAVADFDPQAHQFALKRLRDVLGAHLEP